MVDVNTLFEHARELQSKKKDDDRPDCLVPETENEQFDCCGSDGVETECKVFGVINAIVLGVYVVGIIIMCLRSSWFRNQRLLACALIFQILSAVWATMFYMQYGHKGATTFSFITFRSSHAGDFVVSITGLVLYMYEVY